MKRILYISTALLFLLMNSFSLEAQCAMCKATAEQSDVVGLNLGIFVLFAMPYIVVSTIGFLWWKNKRNIDEEKEGLHSIQSDQFN